MDFGLLLLVVAVLLREAFFGVVTQICCFVVAELMQLFCLVFAMMVQESRGRVALLYGRIAAMFQPDSDAVGSFVVFVMLPACGDMFEKP